LLLLSHHQTRNGQKLPKKKIEKEVKARRGHVYQASKSNWFFSRFSQAQQNGLKAKQKDKEKKTKAIED
jgi:hypothetical protein